ncbi:MAG: YihY/virulence factor BrkB family protein [Gemmatimonadota bacterium]
MPQAVRSAFRRILRLAAMTARSAYAHSCQDAAASMAFDFVFAIFPGLLVLTTLLGILEIPLDAFNQLFRDLGIVVPGPVANIFVANIRHLSSRSLFFLGIAGVIWPASASMSTTMAALTAAYGACESRGFWFRRGLSVILVISLGLSLVILFNLSAFSDQVEGWLARRWSVPDDGFSLAGALRRLIGVVGTLAAVAAIYRVAPDVKQRWVEVLPGSLLFLGLWTVIAGGFGYFVRNFGYYNLIYGVLGGVIVLLLSAYLVAFTLLIGGELNGNLLKMRGAAVPLPADGDAAGRRPRAMAATTPSLPASGPAVARRTLTGGEDT